MEQWEYIFVALGYSTGWGEDAVTRTPGVYLATGTGFQRLRRIESEGKETTRHFDRSVAQAFFHLGVDGWQLVCADGHGIWFKRLKTA